MATGSEYRKKKRSHNRLGSCHKILCFGLNSMYMYLCERTVLVSSYRNATLSLLFADFTSVCSIANTKPQQLNTNLGEWFFVGVRGSFRKIRKGGQKHVGRRFGGSVRIVISIQF